MIQLLKRRTSGAPSPTLLRLSLSTLVFALAACSGGDGTDNAQATNSDLDAGSRDPGQTDASPADDDDGDAGPMVVADPTVVTLSEVGKSGFGCPQPKFGPGMVLVSEGTSTPFCIDKTEVTQAQFERYLAGANRGGAGFQVELEIPGCSKQVAEVPAPRAGGFDECPTFTPYDPISMAHHPVVCVDWCDAMLFCRDDGKTLCGAPQFERVGGAPAGGITSPTSSDAAEEPKPIGVWEQACRGGDRLSFPYGSQFSAEQCHAEQAQPITTQQCEGPIADLHDLVGNVAEWTGSCDGAVCEVRGGSHLDANATDERKSLSCTASEERPKGARLVHTGFRCCAAPL